jgi:8-hydroxy-5-deazaflavin:NADPH oxidoreductase
MSTRKIAIIGNGNVGSAIQKGAEKAGYEVRTTGADANEVRAAGSWADIIVLAIPAPARADAVKNLGNVEGKVLVDPTNLLNADWSYAGEVSKSGAEQVQEWAKGARVVKAFNTVFAQNMTTGKVNGESLSLLAAGDHDEAKKQVLELGNAIGFQSVDVGPLSNARYLEALGFLNIQLGYGPTKYGTDIGFKLVGNTGK